MLFVYLCGTGIRLHQHISIKEDPAFNAAGDIILTTQDGYRWLRYAKNYEKGLDRLSGVPPVTAPPEKPLISVLASDAETGSLLTVFTACLFVFPLGILFYLLGCPVAGVGAAVVAAFSLAYLGRTSAFQIDTDSLNIFFISMGCLLAYLAGRGRALLWSALLGLCMYAFWRWYFHSGFTVIFFLMLIFAVRRTGWRAILTASAVYILLSSPFVFFRGFFGLFEFFSGADGGGVHADVAELAVRSFTETFALVTVYWPIGFAGLAVSLMLRRGVVWLMPFYLLGLLAFAKGERYAMFLAPVCGAGLGIAFDYLKTEKLKPLACALVISVAVLALYRPYIGKIPPPVVGRDVYEAIKKLDIPEHDAVIGTAWGDGFMVEYLTGRGVFADGASQFKSGSEVYAQALFGVNSCSSAENLLTASGGRPVYMLCTPDMDKKLGSLLKTAGLQAHESEKRLVLTGIDENKGKSSVKLSDTIFFKQCIIGSADIECFSQIYKGYQGIVLYKAIRAGKREIK